MTLVEAAVYAVTYFAGAWLASVVIILVVLARRRLAAQAADVYAGFRADNAGASGELPLLACEGHCDGATEHETDGDGGATCVLCGTHRSALPGLAAVDEA
ncbi:hypothetical protein PV413_23840 [Streptomyces scabiei]|uniref:hypothetical protein n=1 Tax=Streptomyces scabiei TaxID=1930 RepID=UPI0029A31EEF|nr:hypothetical protein [Streptomyces scabiei]MDX2566055.1 hypothetical protein [Streptomyces scabiei]MDX3150461.1 hypothetical protein [Streptomyces scabiei]MDX3161916.1 hypothetical protein [Streptomyces scabiei]MDX3288095.1 hypothetical protein [Streptomyces scabiei]